MLVSDGGVVDYLEVLDTERTLFSSELDESATLEQALTAVVQLQKRVPPTRRVASYCGPTTQTL
jgi:hypothetical protein